jgi:hypothetical protein
VSIIGANSNQADATVSVRNGSADRVNLSGWTRLVGTAAAPLLNANDLFVDPGQTLVLHLSLGTDTPGNVYLGQASGALASSMVSGQRISLTDARPDRQHLRDALSGSSQCICGVGT